MEETSTATRHATTAAPTRPPIVSLVLGTLGCVGWIIAFTAMQRYDQGEQLAAYFSALFNVVILGVSGTVGAILSSIAMFACRRSSRRLPHQLDPIARTLAWLSIVLGIVVLATQLPGPLAKLN